MFRWLALCAMAACVPADEALELGSVQFTFKASQRTQDGIIADETDGYALTFERIVLGFKTMTIGKIGVPDLCSYRGRGAATDVVFDPRFGLVQTFNGIQPVECPDVGVIFGSPSNITTLAEGVTSADLVELARGAPAHGILEATAKRDLGKFGAPKPPGVPLDPKEEAQNTYKIKLRFVTETTSTRFGGCREAARGIRILSNRRDSAIVRFAAENFFRDAISTTTNLAVKPFVQADSQGNSDHIVTMDEVDDMRLSTIQNLGTYQLPDGTRNGSFGDYLRALFRFSLMFRSEEGICVGNEPGSVEDGVENP